MTQSSTKSPWQVDHTVARLNEGRFSAIIDLRRPNLGLNNIAVNGDRVSGCSPLQVSPEPPAPVSGETLIDCYRRGHDLVVTYAQTPRRTVQPTYCWRSLTADNDVVGVELMVSMQTSLLDSDPALSALTECHGEVFWLNEKKVSPITGASWESPADSSGFFLFRLVGGMSYVEMVFPSDFLGARVTNRDVVSRLTYRMFPEALEKGVIRRGRIRALFLSSTNDLKTAWDVYEQLCAEEPPLTT